MKLLNFLSELLVQINLCFFKDDFIKHIFVVKETKGDGDSGTGDSGSEEEEEEESDEESEEESEDDDDIYSGSKWFSCYKFPQCI